MSAEDRLKKLNGSYNDASSQLNIGAKHKESILEPKKSFDLSMVTNLFKYGSILLGVLISLCIGYLIMVNNKNPMKEITDFDCRLHQYCSSATAWNIRAKDTNDVVKTLENLNKKYENIFVFDVFYTGYETDPKDTSYLLQDKKITIDPSAAPKVTMMCNKLLNNCLLDLDVSLEAEIAKKKKKQAQW